MPAVDGGKVNAQDDGEEIFQDDALPEDVVTVFLMVIQIPKGAMRKLSWTTALQIMEEIYWHQLLLKNPLYPMLHLRQGLLGQLRVCRRRSRLHGPPLALWLKKRSRKVSLVMMRMRPRETTPLLEHVGRESTRGEDRRVAKPVAAQGVCRRLVIKQCVDGISFLPMMLRKSAFDYHPAFVEICTRSPGHARSLSSQLGRHTIAVARDRFCEEMRLSIAYDVCPPPRAQRELEARPQYVVVSILPLKQEALLRAPFVQYALAKKAETVRRGQTLRSINTRRLF